MDYRGVGFRVRDYKAEVWLFLLAQQAAHTPAWLAAARHDWHIQATAGFNGCVSSLLDAHLGSDPDREATVVDLSERVLKRLTAWSPAIPKEIVNSFGTGGTTEPFQIDVPTGPLLACGHAFVRLLNGDRPPRMGALTSSTSPGTSSAHAVGKGPGCLPSAPVRSTT
jgi:hypothetical protein